METEKRLVYANEVEEIFNYVENECSDSYNAFKSAIKNATTVDAVEVVHGRWIFGTANHREYMKCSVCLKSQTPTGVFAYCPNCGAKMGGERRT